MHTQELKRHYLTQGGKRNHAGIDPTYPQERV